MLINARAEVVDMGDGKVSLTVEEVGQLNSLYILHKLDGDLDILNRGKTLDSIEAYLRERGWGISPDSRWIASNYHGDRYKIGVTGEIYARRS